MGVLNFLGWGKSKFDQTDALYKQGVRYIGAKNKHLRLYFESQFSPDLEEDDLNYLIHIFEQKTYLLFGSHYSIINLINTDSFLKETYEKLVDTNYRELQNIKITHKFLDNPEMNNHIFNYKIITSLYKEFKICRVNYWAQKSPEISEDFNISPKIIENIKTTNELQIYNFLSDSTNLIYFILNKVFDVYSKSVKKLSLYQIGIKTFDEPIFTFLAMYIKTNPKIDSVCIYGKKVTEIRHLKININPDDLDYKDEILEGEIHNVQHIFNLYQVLAKRSNLIELRIILFLNHYNFAMLSMVMKNNQNLKILQVRNIPNKEMDNELDFGYKELNEYGDDTKDEIFVFFNYLFNLEFLEELQITHFTFMSEISFMAVQCAKTLSRLKNFSLEKNVYLINNDNVMVDNYNISHSKIEYLDMGYAYYHYVRRWDMLINLNVLKEVHIGVCDYVSFNALMRHIEHSSLVKLIVKLNKPVLKSSIALLFETIGTFPMRAKYLRYLYVLNAFDVDAFGVEPEDKNALVKLKEFVKLFGVMRMNKTLRRLGFAKPCRFFLEIKDDENYKAFKYIRERDLESCIFLAKALQRLFKNSKMENVNQIIKNIIIMRFSTYRKIITK